ncbi:MAG: hypothetical protein IPP94_03405 [Ignavibacteria bacterium]|nr:hypothetical protein [Ignavibacteria bacterium]
MYFALLEKQMRALSVIALAALLCASLSHGLRGQTKGHLASKGSGAPVLLTNDAYETLSVNNILQWFSNNGSMSHNPATDASGFEWPRGSSKHLMFSEGLIFAGRVNGEIRAGGATYRYGLQAGPILANGQPADPADPAHRVYKARKISRAGFDALPSAERDRLRRDFNEWPSTLGAPWMDSNHNGIYDPDFDGWLFDSTASDKPLWIGDVMLWFVSNDLDSVRSTRLYGPGPMSLEIRTLAWGFEQNGTLANTVFQKHTIINRNSSPVTDLYFGRWIDPDIGEGKDDLVGTDTTRDMIFACNGRTLDAVYGNPPGIATALLQGPIVPESGAVAEWNFGKRDGWRNLRITASHFYIGADPVYADPQLGTVRGAAELRNQMEGLLSTGRQILDPITRNSTTFVFAGDPVTGQGWVDGAEYQAGDYRMIMSTGAVTMAPGDTQEVVFADIVADGGSIREDIVTLRRAADEVRQWYNVQPYQVGIPTSTFASDFPTSNTTRISVQARASGAIRAMGLLYRKDGSLLDSIPLFDDGAHDDGAAGDRLFAGQQIRPARSPFGARCALKTWYPDAGLAEWPSNPCLPLSGAVRASVKAVESDHRNFDHVANPGENIRVSITLANESPFTLGPVAVRNAGFMPLSPQDFISSWLLPPLQSLSIPYDAVDSNSFVSFDIPDAAADGEVFRLPLDIRDTLDQCWCDTLSVTAHAYTKAPFDSLTLHIAGRGAGTLGWRLASRAALKDHTYQITVQGNEFAARREVSILDLTAGTVLATNIPYPDAFAHNAPLTDGWKVTRGTSAIGVVDSISDLSVPETPPRILASPRLDSYLAGTTAFEYGVYFFGSALKWDEYRPVKIVFSTTATQKAYLYLRGGTLPYAFQAYVNVPLRAYDISDSSSPRQLNLAFVEQSGGPRNNNTWDPAAAADREYLFVLGSTYSPTPDPALMTYQLNADAQRMDIQYVGWYYRHSDTTKIPEGAVVTLLPQLPVTSRDTFLINPFRSVPPAAPPVAFQLGQIYPNPVGLRTGNATVTIALGVETRGTYTLSLHDMLGRRVATLFEGVLDPGRHAVLYTPPPRLGSGSYRIVATHAGGSASAPLMIIR